MKKLTLDKILKISMAGLALTSLAACSKPKEKPRPSLEPYEETVTWESVEERFQKLEAKIQNDYQDGYTLKEGEEVELLALMVDGYENIRDGVFDNEIDGALKVYEGIRKLELSGDTGLQAVGESMKELLFSALGFNAADGIISSYNVYANLMNYADVLEVLPEEPKGYNEELINIEENGTTVEPEMVDPSANPSVDNVEPENTTEPTDLPAEVPTETDAPIETEAPKSTEATE